jgi:dihydrofolate reductase
MRISLIVAIGANRAIGKNNRLLWRLPNDMKFFKETTSGHPVITGRRNYESIPEAFRPLPDRQNIVVTSQRGYSAPGALVVHSIEEALQEAQKSATDEIFIIGGGKVYVEVMEKKLIDRMYITHVHADFEADTFFPGWNAADWSVETIAQHPADDRHAYSFDIRVYDRVQ